MKAFEVYHHPTHGYEAVKLGFSWPAFFFNWIWMFVKRLTLHGSACLALILVLMYAEVFFDPAIEAPDVQGLMYLMLTGAYLALWLVPAFQGNRWRVENLTQRGYDFLGTIDAQTPEAAIAGFRRGVEMVSQ